MKVPPSVKATIDSLFKDVIRAKVYDVAIETPLQYAKFASKRLQNRVFLKREDLQPVFSFKLRGAYNKIANLTMDQKKKGIVACSAGNHAQGVAMSARSLDIPATIVMPKTTPKIKVASVERLGGTVLLDGDNYTEAYERALTIVKNESKALVHPFDDPLVIAGQGTIAMEIIKQFKGESIDAVFVCCGGGGMLSGISAFMKTVFPNTKIIGVEAADAAGMTRSIEAGEVVSLDHVGIFADGAAVKRVGDLTFDICNELVDEMVTVDSDEICQAIRDTYYDTRAIMEPAGALAMAGANKWVRENKISAQNLAVVCSGANMDFNQLRFISDRAESSEKLIAIQIPEQPGAFKQLYYDLAYSNIKNTPRSITEFSYRYAARAKAYIILSFGITGPEDASTVLRLLKIKGYEIFDLEGNEMAKLHARYLGGGRASLDDEVLYRFAFPERPGALEDFLNFVSDEQRAVPYNVTMFHYRNRGSLENSVLVGMQIAKTDKKDLEHFLDQLGFDYFDETRNLVYNQFLCENGI
uniref:Threonine dehydratase n=1 Tax=Amorphochlora amoebiformis TaxID=1561963 RepID=A0A7S0CPQ1_9EUKA|mmetsp:Transcript_10332/g.16307  ORF Transcript_10332/g.16307 Transcript_10332/m.16307 type:complete len:526 (+) Transcript_10332:113-1690(+)